MLPSPLGLDQADCNSRCKLSDAVSFGALTDCWRRDAPDAGAEALWCQSPAGAPVCAAFSACIEGSYPAADITGQATLRVAFVSTASDTPPSVVRAASNGACEADVAPPSTVPTANDCAALSIQSMTILVEERVEEAVTTLPCSGSTLQDLVIPALRPGALRPIIEIRAVPGSDATQPVECRRFYGPRVVVAANQSASSAVPIPTTVELFATGDACLSAGASQGADAGSSR